MGSCALRGRLHDQVGCLDTSAIPKNGKQASPGGRASVNQKRDKKKTDYFVDGPSVRSDKPCCGCPDSIFKERDLHREALVISRCKQGTGSDSKKSWDVLNCSTRKREQFLHSITKNFYIIKYFYQNGQISFHCTWSHQLEFNGIFPIDMHLNGKRTFPASTAKTYLLA